MALVLADRVQQTGTANTTVSFTLSGSVVGFQSFSVVGNGNTTYYSTFDQFGNWEVGIGTYSTTGPTLTRTTVLASSNSGSAVTFSGTVNVFITQPAENTVVSSNNPGSSTYVLTSNGAGVAPSWQPGGAGTLTTTDFTATAGQTVFTVNYVVGFVSVYRNGIKLGNADYTATSGTSITLATGATAGDLIEVQAVSNLNLYSTITYEDFSGTGSQTAFTMSVSPPNAASVLVAISGVVQDPANYIVSGTTLTFSTAPASGTNNISVRYLGIPTVGTVSSFSGGTTGLTPSIATTGAVTLGGTLAIANGGTNTNATPTAGGVNYGTGTAQAYTAAGTAGYYLQSNGASAPSWSAVTIPTVIPTGSVLLFYQSAAPTGWTQVTSVNDHALRLVSGTGGTTGGTTAFSTVFANQTPTITTSGLSAAATTLSSTQIPSHSHSADTGYSSPCGGYTRFGAGINAVPSTATTNSTGGGGSHTHSLTGSATSSAITLNVQYANVILCSKN